MCNQNAKVSSNSAFDHEQSVWSCLKQLTVIDCGHPGTFPNGYIEVHSTTIGSVIRFFCFDRMVYEGVSNTSVCSSNGTWSPLPFPKCLAECTVPEVSNGKVLDFLPHTKVKHGQALNISCIKSYELYSDTGTIVCNNGSWSQMPDCAPARCKKLPQRPRNGFVVAPKTDHGMPVLFRCKDGYLLQGPNMTWCYFGEWNISSPRCIEIYCPWPGYIEHGKVLLVGYMGMYDYRPYVKRVSNNKQIIYECDRDYHIETGPPGATCVHGKWQPGELPKCTRVYYPKNQQRWNRSLRRKMGFLNDYDLLNSTAMQDNDLVPSTIHHHHSRFNHHGHHHSHAHHYHSLSSSRHKRHPSNKTRGKLVMKFFVTVWTSSFCF